MFLVPWLVLAVVAEWEEGSEQQRRAAASLHEALGRP